MASGFKSISGLDLDSVFTAGSGGAATAYKVGADDLNTRYHPYTTGEFAPTTGYTLAGGADLNTRFQSAGVPIFAPVNPLPGNGNTYTDSQGGSNTARVQIALQSNGVMTISNSVGVLLSGNWGAPTTTDVGSGYWVQFVVGSNTGSTGTAFTATTAVLPLTSTQLVEVTATYPGTAPPTRARTTVYTVNVYSNAAGTVLVASGSITLTATGT